jgi:hypothetical protein
VVQMLLNKDAVGSATDGVKPDLAGSMMIHPHRGKPADTVNRLPAPAGNFILTFRPFTAESPILDGCYRLPAVKPVE